MKRRLDSMFVANNLEEFNALPGNCHPLTADRKGQWAVALDHPKRLVFEPIGDPLPISKDGRLDCTKVTAVRLMEVVDYHG